MMMIAALAVVGVLQLFNILFTRSKILRPVITSAISLMLDESSSTADACFTAPLDKICASDAIFLDYDKRIGRCCCRCEEGNGNGRSDCGVSNAAVPFSQT